MRSSRPVFILGLALLSPVANAQEEGFRVEGHAFNLETRIPLAGAQIDLFYVDPRALVPEGPTATAFTDANGSYSVELQVFPGFGSWYLLEARCTGKRAVGSSNSQLREASSLPNGLVRRDLYLDVTRGRVRIVCKEGGDRPPGSFPRRPGFVGVEGYAFNTRTGVPLAGARIEIFDLGRPIRPILPPRPFPPIAVVHTDSNGFYSVSGLLSRVGFRLGARCTEGRHSALTQSGHPLIPDENRRDLYLDVTRRAGPIQCEEAEDLPPR